MAIEAKIIDNGRGVEIICSGIITGKDVIEAQVISPPDDIMRHVRYLLIDYSGVKESYVSLEEVRLIAKNDQKFLVAYPSVALVVVVPNDLFRMLSGVWKESIDIDQARMQLFEQRKAAEEWIRTNIAL